MNMYFVDESTTLNVNNRSMIDMKVSFNHNEFYPIIQPFNKLNIFPHICIELISIT